MEEEFINIKTLKIKNHKRRKINTKMNINIFNKRQKQYQEINKLTKPKTNFIKCSFYLICLFIIIPLIFYFKFIKTKHYNINYIESNTKINKKAINKSDKLGNFEIDENYPENFEKEVFDKIEPKFSGHLIMYTRDYYFINGLIRKYKPKKILEIGVCSGGVSAAILNAIKDRKDAFLYSCDLETENYRFKGDAVGSFVKTNFPEFLSQWKLYVGNTTGAFIEEIGGDIDFVFIDTAHVMPGEVLNLIEILPFLKKGAFVALDDINNHANRGLFNLNNFYPTNNLLFSVLRGKKIIFRQKNDDTFEFTKLGAVILDENQENYYFEYFYLLSNNWSYMPNQFEIDVIRNIVSKYYKPYFLSIFDKAVILNYQRLKQKGLLKKDYILYTYPIHRKKPHS